MLVLWWFCDNIDGVAQHCSISIVNAEENHVQVHYDDFVIISCA